jgi:hypothetical protein
MNCKTRRKHSRRGVEFPPPFVPMRLDQVLWDFAQFYGKLFRADHPDLKLSIDQAVLAGALAFEERVLQFDIPILTEASLGRQRRSFSVKPALSQGNS